MDSDSPMLFYAVAASFPQSKRLPPLLYPGDLPPIPNTNAQYTFTDEAGNIVPCPNPTQLSQPPYCFVQYIEKYPPPPPFGYVYVGSELQKDMCSSYFHIFHEVGSPRYGIDTPDHSGLVMFEGTVQEQSGMDSTIYETKDGYFSKDSDSQISNYKIEPISVVRVHGMNEYVREVLEYKVHFKGQVIADKVEHNLEELEKLPEAVIRKYAVCSNYFNASKVEQQIVFHIRKKLPDLPKIEKYCSSGMQQIKGTWIYAQDEISMDGVIFDTKFKIAANPDMSAHQAMQNAMGILALSSQLPVIIPMVLLAHLGVMFTLFEQAGFPPRIIVFVNGKTGSLKTAVCAVLFNLTGEHNKNIPSTFRDTIASVEAKFPDYADKVLLLDDYSPATTAKSRAEMNKLLEDVIRYYGDGKGRARSNVTVTKSTSTVPRGLCCITGEDTGGSQSSLLRCLLIDVANGTFNGEVLAPYQSDPRLWTTHFNYFTRYVAQKFDVLSNEIRSSFPRMRNELKKVLTAGRSIDNAVFLCLTAKILLQYGVDIGWITRDAAEQQLVIWENAVVEAVKCSEEYSSDFDPVRFYIQTLFEAVDAGAAVIAPSKEAFLKDTSMLGYEQDGTWHIWPDKAYDLASNRCQRQHKIFPLSEKKIHAALSYANVINVTTEKRNDGTEQVNYLYRESFGNRPRMLVMNKEVCCKILEEGKI